MSFPFELANDPVPSSYGNAQIDVGYLEELPVDPWGIAYQYLAPGEHGAFDLYSHGADGIPGGDGFDELELDTCRQWLRSKANSIEGGTTEINLNVIAKRVLGLS